MLAVIVVAAVLNGLIVPVVGGNERLFLGAFEPFLPQPFGILVVTSLVILGLIDLRDFTKSDSR